MPSHVMRTSRSSGQSIRTLTNQRRAEFEKDIPEIYNILKKGTEQAREVGAQTMDEVRKAMRIDYFNDTELIREQAERFAK